MWKNRDRTHKHEHNVEWKKSQTNTCTMIQFRQSSKTCKTNNILFDITNIYGKMIKKSKEIKNQNSGS